MQTTLQAAQLPACPLGWTQGVLPSPPLQAPGLPSTFSASSACMRVACLRSRSIDMCRRALFGSWVIRTCHDDGVTTDEGRLRRMRHDMELLLLALRGAWRRHIHAAVPGGLGVSGAGAPAGHYLGRCCAGPLAGAPLVLLLLAPRGAFSYTQGRLASDTHLGMLYVQFAACRCLRLMFTSNPSPQVVCCHCMPSVSVGLTVFTCFMLVAAVHDMCRIALQAQKISELLSIVLRVADLLLDACSQGAEGGSETLPVLQSWS